MAAGRKRIIWADKQFQQFETLCSMQCTEEEICAVLDVTDKTLNRLLKEHYGKSYKEAYERFSSVGKVSLRRTQLKIAEHGSDRMAIWLGKQYLGQKEPMQEIRQMEGTQEAVSDLPTAWVSAVVKSGDVAVPDELKEEAANAEAEE